MKIPQKIRKFRYCAAILLGASALAITTTPLLAHGASDADKSQAPGRVVRNGCTFSDGSTITIGRGASGASDSDSGIWRTGDYEATTFRVSKRMHIAPLDGGIEIPPGRYTLFVIDMAPPPWTLILSKKVGKPGMPYPGEQYDLGRSQIGSDVRPPVEHFTIGCIQYKNAPIFLWMQSGTKVGYAKIMSERARNGKTEYLWH